MRFRVLEIDGGFYVERKSFLGKWEFAAWDSDKFDHTGRTLPTKFETAEEAEQTIREMYTPPVVKTFSLKTYFSMNIPDEDESKRKIEKDKETKLPGDDKASTDKPLESDENALDTKG